MKVLKLILTAGLMLTLVFLSLGCERKVTHENLQDDQASFNSCFTCHGEDGYILAAQGEWLNSVHASGNNVDYTNRLGRDCSKCHDHQGFLQYLSTGTVSPPYDQVSAIHCFTCHSPHVRGNLTLRTDLAYTLENDVVFNVGDGNLCVNCHHANFDVRTIADSTITSSHWGSHHGPQGDLLVGTGGYEFTGESYDKNNSHANLLSDGCVHCHMGNVETHNGYHVGGHSFNMEYVSDEGDTTTLVGICDVEGCHLGADSYDVDSVQTHVAEMLDSLSTLFFALGIVDADGDPKTDTLDQDLAGALYNYVIVREDRSMGVHNGPYIMDLLSTSIDYVETLMPAVNNESYSALTTRMRSSH